MDLRQLEYFVAVAEEANFTRAAARVHISQSGVSAQVRQLERELGVELIDRSSRAATPTAAGRAALGPARAALAAAAAVRQAVDEIDGLLRGRLAVAMVTACTVAPLFDALAAFHRAHPGVELSLSEASSDQMLDQVRAGDVDLALVGCADRPPPDLAARTITRDDLVALVPDDHALAGRRKVALTEVVTHPLVCLPPGTGIRTVLDRACAAQGLQPTVTLEASAPETVADLARRGLGVAILSASMPAALDRAGRRAARLVAVPVTGAGVAAVLALVWRPAASNPALDELVRLCDRAFAAPNAA
jgi:DNA-binding transcriptional LysR family regulator